VISTLAFTSARSRQKQRRESKGEKAKERKQFFQEEDDKEQIPAPFWGKRSAQENIWKTFKKKNSLYMKFVINALLLKLAPSA